MRSISVPVPSLPAAVLIAVHMLTSGVSHAAETSTMSTAALGVEVGASGLSNKRSNIPAISEACPVGTTVQLPAVPSSISTASFKSKPRDRSCFVSAESILKRRIGETQFVDVRHAADFEQYRIPGSLNIPLQFIKTKTFLKTGSVVLVNDGHSTAELEAGCSELKKAGFIHVSVLDGGLSAWRAQGGSLDGDVFAQRQLDRMSTEALFAERLYDDWLVLDFSTSTKDEIRKWLPPSVERLRVADALSALKVVSAKIKQSKRPLKLLVVSDTGSDYAKIEKQIRQAGLHGALYLETGLQGYSDFLSKQVAMWEQKTKPPKLPACRG